MEQMPLAGYQTAGFVSAPAAVLYSLDQPGDRTMSRKQIGDFELVDHGIENSQYFQGCGVSHTRFENVATGIGNNPAEAIDDCLEQIAQCDFDTEGLEARILLQYGRKKLPLRPRVKSSAEDTYYHVSIRWNPAEIGNHWRVVVGNIGEVYSGAEETIARATFDEYVKQSGAASGRAAGESVILFQGEEIAAEHTGAEYDD